MLRNSLGIIGVMLFIVSVVFISWEAFDILTTLIRVIGS
jgi:hypothetical protein